MKTPSKQLDSRPVETFGKVIKSRLTAWWRYMADFINVQLARTPVLWLKVFFVLLSTLFGVYCLSLITGFL